MKVATWNCRGKGNYQDALRYFSKNKEIQFVAIQEAGNIALEEQFGDYIVVAGAQHSGAANQRCVTAIFQHKDLSLIGEQHLSSLPSSCGRSVVIYTGAPFIFASVHAHHTEGLSDALSAVRNVIQYAQDRKWVLGGDFNESFNDLKTRLHPSMNIGTFSRPENACLAIPGTHTHTSGETYDGFMHSPDLKASSLTVCHERFGSDHYPIFCEFY